MTALCSLLRGCSRPQHEGEVAEQRSSLAAAAARTLAAAVHDDGVAVQASVHLHRGNPEVEPMPPRCKYHMCRISRTGMQLAKRIPLLRTAILAGGAGCGASRSGPHAAVNQDRRSGSGADMPDCPALTRGRAAQRRYSHRDGRGQLSRRRRGLGRGCGQHGARLRPRHGCCSDGPRGSIGRCRCGCTEGGGAAHLQCQWRADWRAGVYAQCAHRVGSAANNVDRQPRESVRPNP